MTKRLARLEQVALRLGWSHEAGSFTPWLAEAENLAILADTLGVRLELEGTEVNVGPFRADILCRDAEKDTLVLIENQLERTDHLHLGQIITYVAGLEAKTVIWIASAFTEEHRAALDWLNDATDERYHFFGVEVELWRIGDSDPAPRFNVAVKPNDWGRSAARVARSVESGALSPIGQRRLAYWTGFKRYLEDQQSRYVISRESAASNLTFSTGQPGMTLKTYRATDDIGVFLRIHGADAEERFTSLSERREQIEAAFGSRLKWTTTDGGASYWIVHALKADPDDENDWPRQFQFMEETMSTFAQFIAA